jgi:hypothetical protein
MRSLPLLVIVALCAPNAAEVGRLQSGRMEVSLTSTAAIHSTEMGAGLRLEVRRRLDANDHVFGWGVSVVRIADGQELLDSQRPAHGPYYTDVYGWSSRTHFMPDERRLEIERPPIEVVIRLVGAETTTPTDTADSQFTDGTLVITWRPIRGSMIRRN